jgi:hypothetical protein
MKKLVILGQELDLKWSPAFETKAACPFLLHAHYIERATDKFLRIPAERGKAAHLVVDELLSYCVDNEIVPNTMTDDSVRESLERHATHHIYHEIENVFTWCRLWKQRFKLPAAVIGIEEKLGLDEYFEECDFSDASYRGIIDLLQIKDNHAVITDWKSQPNILPQTDLDTHQQGTFYCWLISKMYPHVETFTFKIWYLRYGFQMSTTRTEEDLEIFEQALMIKEKKILEIDNWDPIPGPQCQYCDVIHRCPIALDLSPEQPAIISQEQAVIAAQKITVIETILKALKGGLKEYVKANDDILIGDNWIYGFRHVESEKFDITKVAGVLEEHDHDLSDYANLDLKKIKKLIKLASREDPSLESSLRALSETKNSTRFEGYKRKD